MAVVKIGASGTSTNMLAYKVAGIFDYDFFTRSSTGLRSYDNRSNYTEFKGSGLAYVMSSSGEIADVTRGTVNSFVFAVNGVKLYEITGLNVSASKLFDFAATGNSRGFIETLLSGNDTITGTRFADVIISGAGNDTVSGAAGNDTIDGGAGNDTLNGGTGKDKLTGGSGVDTATYVNATVGVVASLASPKSNTNEAAGDTYSSIENLTGSKYKDTLIGNDLANVLSGGAGDDVLRGNGGADTLYGGAGADDLYGGTGADRFVFKALAESTAAVRDTIFDFSSKDGDKIDLSAIDANSKIGGNQAFSFIGTAAFHGKAGELRFEKKASDTYVYVDVNGDKKADFTIHLDDPLTLKSSDFIL